MTHRNYDWSPLGVWRDPVPGDPAYVAQQAASMSTSADAMLSAAYNLRRLEAPATCSEAITKILRQSSKAAEMLDEAGTRYHSAASALTTYAPRLTHAQDESLAALNQAALHRGDEQAAYRKSVKLYWAAKATIDPVERGHLVQQYQNVRAHQVQATTALNRAKARLQGAIDERDGAADRAAGAVEAASSGGTLNDSAWDKFADFVQPLVDGVDNVAKWIWAHIDEISLVLSIAAIALAWVPGLNVVLAGLAMGANVLSKAKAAYTFVTGVAEGLRTGNWGAAAMGAAALALSFVGGKAVGALAKKAGAQAGATVAKAVTSGVRKSLQPVNRTLKNHYTTLATKRVHHLRLLINKSHMESGTANSAVAALRKSPLYHKAAPEIDKIYRGANAATRAVAAKTDAMLSTVRGGDYTHEMRDAVGDLVKLGRHHDISDALIDEIAEDTGAAAGKAVEGEVKDRINDVGNDAVDEAATWVDEQQKRLESHRIATTPCGAR